MRVQVDRPTPTRYTQPPLIVDLKALCISIIDVIILLQIFVF